MKLSRRRLHRLCLSGALSLAVLIGVSLFVRVQVSPWTSLMCGEARFETKAATVYWFDMWVIDDRIPWPNRFRLLGGVATPWVQRYLPGSFIVFVPWNSTVPYTAIMIRLPLIYPMFILAAIAWWTYQRRAKPGHCRCGYDLTGNVSGRCPECGASISVGATHEA